MAAIGGLIYYFLQLDGANSRIVEQQRQIDEQRDLIEKKEIFGAAMEGLMETAAAFDGKLFATLVPLDHYDVLAAKGWAHRWDSSQLDRDTAEVAAAKQELDEILLAATAQVTSNASGTTNEAVTDQLGSGLVASVVDDADTLCEDDVLACVVSDDPYTVHFDAGDISLPYMTDFLRTGIAYHEFAHVLQLTNPVPTEAAVAAFDGDVETMADCFALTYLDGWKLDHRIFVSSNQYYQVSIGYGYTCNSDQMQSIRDWYGQLGVRIRPVAQ